MRGGSGPQPRGQPARCLVYHRAGTRDTTQQRESKFGTKLQEVLDSASFVKRKIIHHVYKSSVKVKKIIIIAQ